MDRGGQIYLELENRTTLPLEELRVLFVYRAPDGRVRQESRLYGARIDPGEAGILILGSQYVAAFNTMLAQVTSAVSPDAAN